MSTAAPRLVCEPLPLGAVPTAAEGSIGAAALRGELGIEGFSVALTVEDVRPPPDPLEPASRAALAARLELCLATLRPHVAVLDSIRALKEPGASLVVTGQQPGLLVSPLLSLYKALQALRLARRLAQAWERPVVALFWNHADDHDIAEVHHACARCSSRPACCARRTRRAARAPNARSTCSCRAMARPWRSLSHAP
jgi:hypothetical protein